MTTLQTFLAQEQPHVNAALASAAAELPPSVAPIARYAMGRGGKRLRPLLTVLVSRLLGYPGDDIYSLAAAMEMFHVATLLHDDVMDNAGLRRGQTATHKVFGVTETILTGDALLAKGNQIVASFGDPRLTAAASEAISRTTEGEILEIANQGKRADTLLVYNDIIAGKTAWMIRIACLIGALRSGSSDQTAQQAAEYGFNLGMAFQIVDDALDFAPASQTGKPEGGDIREGKLTPPIFYYAESLDSEAKEAFFNKFSTQTFSGEDILHIIHAVRTLGLDEKTRALADTYLHKAQEALDSLTETAPPSAYRDILAGFIGYVRNREA